MEIRFLNIQDHFTLTQHPVLAIDKEFTLIEKYNKQPFKNSFITDNILLMKAHYFSFKLHPTIVQEHKILGETLLIKEVLSNHTFAKGFNFISDNKIRYFDQLTNCDNMHLLTLTELKERKFMKTNKKGSFNHKQQQSYEHTLPAHRIPSNLKTRFRTSFHATLIQLQTED